jgi:hypothetical protein
MARVLPDLIDHPEGGEAGCAKAIPAEIANAQKQTNSFFIFFALLNVTV